jgi:glycosyltransferase involved in cell wall biosynthesis
MGLTGVYWPEPVWDSRLVARIRRRVRFWRHSPHGISMDTDYGYAKTLRRLLSEKRFDTVIIEHLYMMQYARFVTSCPVFYSAHNVETIKYERWHKNEPDGIAHRFLYRAQKAVLHYHESRVGTRAAAVFATSNVDRDILRKMNRGGRFIVVPNGADLDYFLPRSQESFRGPPSVIFIGSLFYKPNADAVRFLVNEVMPILRRQCAECECHIVGKTAGNDFSYLHHPETGVFLHGSVPDIRPFLQSSKVLVVPLFVGSGTRIKILESMASGTPVVSTRLGAEGIDYTEGVDICLAETAFEMAKDVETLLCNPEEAYRMGQAGRSLVETKYSWDRSAAIMRTEIDAVLSGKRD